MNLIETIADFLINAQMPELSHVICNGNEENEYLQLSQMNFMAIVREEKEGES